MKYELWEFFVKQYRFYWYWFYVTFVVNRTIRTTVSIYFFAVRNLYGSLINLKKNIYNTTGRKTYATTAPSVLILHSIHCCYCCCWGCGPFLDTVKTSMFNNKFFKFRSFHSLFRIFASIKLIPISIFCLHRLKHGTLTRTECIQKY